jgi:hypothetical protein
MSSPMKTYPFQTTGPDSKLAWYVPSGPGCIDQTTAPVSPLTRFT